MLESCLPNCTIGFSANRSAWHTIEHGKSRTATTRTTAGETQCSRSSAFQPDLSVFPSGICSPAVQLSGQALAAPRLERTILCAPHEGPERRHDPVGRFFRQKMPAILELVQFEVRQRGLPPFEFLLAERDILEPPEKERWLVRKGRAVAPD